MSQFRILNVGFGNIVLVSKIVGIVHSDSASAKRIRNEAKSNNSLIDATQGKKPVRSSLPTAIISFFPI